MPANDCVIPNSEPSRIQVDSERYWAALLADFNSVPFTEPSEPIPRPSSTSASLCVTTSSSDKSQLKYEDLRLTLLNAWAVVISHLHYAASQDVVIAEGMTVRVLGFCADRKLQYQLLLLVNPLPTLYHAAFSTLLPHMSMIS